MNARLSTSYNPLYQAKLEEPENQKEELTTSRTETSRPSLHLVSQEGQLQVHTAAYRGSFSVVLSEALRSAGLGSRVMVAQFLKGGVNQGPNGYVRLCGTLEWLRPDVSECLSNPVSDSDNDSESQSCKQAVLNIWEICKNRLMEGNIDQLVLDEVGLAIALGYIQESDVLATLEERPGAVDVIITGPSIPSRIIDMADQITELRSGF